MHPQTPATEKDILNSRENTLRAIRLEQPDFVPVFDGTVWEAFALGGNFEWQSFTDHWGVVWQAELSGLVPVDVVHPLADLGKLGGPGCQTDCLGSVPIQVANATQGKAWFDSITVEPVE
jgi:hypothetical protein